MALKFGNDSFTVQVGTGSNPAEDWVNTVGSLIDVLENQDDDLSSTTKNRNVLRLLREMMPDVTMARKMTVNQ